jgi:tRNA (adenine-N(1)-)-methyltransferase non-catalytic subunit
MSTTTEENNQQQQEQQHQFQTITAGDTIIVRSNDGCSYVFANVQANTNVKLAKKTMISLSSLIGQPYNAFYDIDKKNKNVVLLTTYPDREPLYEEEETKSDLQNDNRELVDDNHAQQLSNEEIENLKQQNSGNEIIQKLVENSSSFATRHTFSKDKYLKKKKKKYLSYIKVLPPTVHEIGRHYMEKKPDKISHLRYDSLAQLLHLGNVFSNNQIIVAESCMGLVTAAVLERLNGYGRILKVAPNVSENMHIVNLMKHLPTNAVGHQDEPIIVHVPFSLIGKMQQTEEEAKEVIKEATTDIVMEEANSENGTKVTEAPKELSDEARQRYESKVLARERKLEEEARIVQLLERKSDCLLIAGNSYDPETFLIRLWPYLQNSGSFVIHSLYLQPLQRCYNLLRAKEHNMNAIMLNLSETWTRDQQVLPYRTHPVMRMHATSGYILSGTKVE